jgi:hypothetical protein
MAVAATAAPRTSAEGVTLTGKRAEPEVAQPG